MRLETLSLLLGLKKAEEIYHERIARGEYGTAQDDWHKAEQLLKGSTK